jgi:uncharacterized protein (UPF0548 family)
VSRRSGWCSGPGPGWARSGCGSRARWSGFATSRTRTGYGFGTLPGHPEHGEEAFLVTRDAGGRAWFEVRAFSRPATWYARLGGPVTHRFQDRVTDGYVSAARMLR